jgi:hypothetical protein
VSVLPGFVDGTSKKITGVRPFEADHLELHAGDALAFDPARRIADHAVDVAVLPPLGIEHRALGRHRDVIGQRRHDLVVPNAVGKIGQGRGFVGLDRQVRVTGVHGGSSRIDRSSVELRFAAAIGVRRNPRRPHGRVMHSECDRRRGRRVRPKRRAASMALRPGGA